MLGDLEFIYNLKKKKKSTLFKANGTLNDYTVVLS